MLGLPQAGIPRVLGNTGERRWQKQTVEKASEEKADTRRKVGKIVTTGVPQGSILAPTPFKALLMI